MREDDANFAQALALAEDLFRPSARDRVALRRARESDLGYGDVTLIGIPTNGALLPYNLAYHILPENFFDDVSTEPSDSELGQAYISRNLLRNLMLWLGKRNFPKYTVPGGWVEEIFQNISYMGVAPPPIFPK